MNYFAHVGIATCFSADEGMALGAMLPDFSSLLGFRTPGSSHQRLLDGILLHHATDAAFHELPLFRLACREQSTRLTHLGLDRGPAIAGAHVGLEFLLDDVLTVDGTSMELFHATLAATRTRALLTHLDWRDSEHADRIENLLARLLAARHPPKGLPSSDVAERIFRTLSARPRLAIGSEYRDVLVAWVREVRLRGTGFFCSLIEQVLAQLATTFPLGQSRPIDSLRFRRAWEDNL